MNRSTRRSIWALAAGVFFVVVITTVVDILMHITGVFPPLDVPIDNRMSLIAISYRIVIGVAGAHLTAKLAPANPIKHVMILGVLGTVLGTLGVVASWGKGLGPSWYPIAIAALAIPQSWVGGRLYLNRL